MERGDPITRDLSARRIVGFACHQVFVLLLLFLGTGFSSGCDPHARTLSITLGALVVGFALARVAGDRLRGIFSRPLLYLYAIVAGGGALFGLAFANTLAEANVLAAVLAGVPSALLLAAWGRAFEREPSRVSTPEVFLGSLAGVLVCLAFSLTIDSTFTAYAICLLPFASVVNIELPSETSGKPPADDPPESLPKAVLRTRVPLDAPDERTQSLSYKILAGTLLFGMAAGIVEVRRAETFGLSSPYFSVVLILFGAFLIGALSLLLSDGFGRGSSLNKSYRLAVFLMMMGILLIPWPLMAASILPGEAVVLAGFLGLEVVLISLFLVLAEITDTDCSRAFSQGFLALFGGYFLGSLVEVAADAMLPDPSASFAPTVLAGALVLTGYVFLFTERDFDALSQIVTIRDALELRTSEIVEEFGLSNREAEILAYALRGRTSERIAQELVISKSTVDTHLRRIYAKCHVHSRQELLDLANV